MIIESNEFTTQTIFCYSYMVEENIHINFNKDYDNVMPEYYRMTYWERRRIKCLWTPKI